VTESYASSDPEESQRPAPAAILSLLAPRWRPRAEEEEK
jgi:hypothetical protein